MQFLRLLASVTIVGTLGAFAVACSPADNDSSTVDGACAQYAAAVNAYNTRCGGTARPSTESRMKAACASALTLSGSAITPQNVSTCANAVKGLSCDTDFEDIAACEFPAGKLAAGATCVDDAQCASKRCTRGADGPCGVCGDRVAIGGSCMSSSQCVSDAQCSGGKCIAQTRNPVGGSCDSTKGELCQSGLYCEFSSKTCKAFVAAGGACSVTQPCGQALTCDPTSKTCVAPTLAAEGQACSDTVRCQNGLACDSSKCARITFVAPGGDCGSTLQICDQGSCNSDTKKCPTVIADGGACVAGDRSQTCARYATCVDGKCSLQGQIVCK